MTAIKYMTVALASCDPDYQDQAFAHCADIAGALKSSGTVFSTRFGQFLTGSHVGHILFLASYADMAVMHAGWQVVQNSAAFQAMGASGKAKLQLRNIVKLEDVFLPEPPVSEPTLGVVTRFTAPTPYVEEMQAILPVFAENGALITRYGTLMTGEATGHRVMAVAYPSMEAIEATYDALAQSEAYHAAIAGAEVAFRNIFRFVG